jgi:hypothetical protein
MKATKARRLPVLLVEGARDVPRNAVWLLSKALAPVNGVKSAANGARDAGGRIAGSVRDGAEVVRSAMPGTGQSVEQQIKRARAAADRAREAEDRALAAAEEAHRRAAEAKEVEDRAKLRLRERRREHAEQVERRVADARRIADARIEEEEREAQAEAERLMEAETARARDELDSARHEAEVAQNGAQHELAEAKALLAEARREAEEATAAASNAAEEAHRQADELTNAAQAQAQELTAADEAQTEASRAVAAAAKKSGGARPRVRTTKRTGPRSRASLDAMTKKQLLALAAKRDISGRSSMSKRDLIKALSAPR